MHNALVGAEQTRRVSAETGERYELGERIGGGAIGEVFRATDLELGRQVAIKLVHPGGPRELLLAEARTMARVTHPNVIRVYDVGTDGGDVFLAMELAEGQTLREWLAGGERSWRRIVDILSRAGRGLAAVHQAGLAHRDFKLESVLVTDDGRVLVTDIGMAHTGAPGDERDEREERDETVAREQGADQHSFCVCLHEALHGSRRPPSRLAQLVRRGLSSDPEERYPSMEALLDELDALRTRRRGRTGLIGAVVGVAVVATAAGWYATTREATSCDGAERLAGAWDDGVRQAVAATFAASELPYARTSIATVITALDRYRADWLGGYRQACEATHVRGEQTEELLDLRMACLDRRRAELAALSPRLGAGSPEAIRGAVAAVDALIPTAVCADAEALLQVTPVPEHPATRGRVEAIRGELAGCSSLHEAGDLREALRCARAAAASADEVDYPPLSAEAGLLVGRVAAKLRNWDEASRALDASLLAADAGNHHRIRAAVLVEHVALAAEVSSFDEGKKRAETAEAVVAGHGGDGRLEAELDHRRGQLATREGELDASQTFFERALGRLGDRDGAEPAAAAEPLYGMAIVAMMRRDYDSAASHLERVLAIQERTLGPEHPAIGQTHHLRAQLLARTGKFDEAEKARELSHRILEASYGEAHHAVAISFNAAATIEILRGDYAAALPLARRAVEVSERASGAFHLDTTAPLQTLAAALNRAGKPGEALETHRRALAIYRGVLGDDHILTTRSMLNVAMGLRLERRCDDALPLLEKALAVRVARLGNEHTLVSSVRHTLGDCYVDLGRPEEAVGLLEAVLRGHTAREPRNANEKVALHMARYALARALWESGADRDRAADLARQAHRGLVDLGDRRASGPALFMKQRRIRPR